MGIWLDAKITTVKDFRFKESPTSYLYKIAKEYDFNNQELMISQFARNGIIKFSLADPDCHQQRIHDMFSYLIKNKSRTGIHMIEITSNYYF